MPDESHLLMLVQLSVEPPDWPVPQFEGAALPREAEADGHVPDLATPVVAEEPKVPHPSNRTLGWIALSLLVHGAALAWLTNSDLPPMTDVMEAMPVEVISTADLAPLSVEADALVSTPEILIAEAPRMVVPEEAATTVLEEAPAPTAADAAPLPLPEPARQPTEVAELPAPEPQREPASLATADTPQPPTKPAPKPRPVKTAPAHAATASAHEPHRAPVSAPAARPLASGPDFAAWQASIFSRLRAAMRYPDGARARGAMGQASIAFSMDTGGRIISASVVHSSGHADLDAEAAAIVRRAAPFPPPPPGAPRSMRVPINFQLR